MKKSALFSLIILTLLSLFYWNKRKGQDLYTKNSLERETNFPAESRPALSKDWTSQHGEQISEPEAMPNEEDPDEDVGEYDDDISTMNAEDLESEVDDFFNDLEYTEEIFNEIEDDDLKTIVEDLSKEFGREPEMAEVVDRYQKSF